MYFDFGVNCAFHVKKASFPPQIIRYNLIMLLCSVRFNRLCLVSGCSAGTSATNAAHYPHCHPSAVFQHRGISFSRCFQHKLYSCCRRPFGMNWTLILKFEHICIYCRQLNVFLAFTSEVEVAAGLCLTFRGQQ